LLSFFLLSAFFYYLMAHNSRNNMGIMRLREDVDDISVRIWINLYEKDPLTW